MAAPAGLCESCGLPMQWTCLDEVMYVRCAHCSDLFEVDGPEVAGTEYHEGHEAMMPDGRPVCPIDTIVQIANSTAFPRDQEVA